MKRLLQLFALVGAMAILNGCGTNQTSVPSAQNDASANRIKNALASNENGYDVRINGQGRYQFGTVTMKASSGYVQFAVQNYGTKTTELTLAEIAVPIGFKIDGRSGCYVKPVLQPGSSCVLNIAFSPLEEGFYSGALVVPHQKGVAARDISGEAIAVNQNDPGTPKILLTNNSAPGTVKIEFEANSRNTNRFLLYCSTNSRMYGPITVSAEERSVMATGLEKGTSYQFQLVAVSPAENKVYSSQPLVYVNRGNAISAPAPRILGTLQTAPYADLGNVYLQWENLPNRFDIDHFEIFNSQNLSVEVADARANGIPVRGLKSGRITFSVVSVSRTGNRTSVAPATFNIKYTIRSTQAPRLAAETGVRNGSVKLSWNVDASFVDHFKIYCSFDGKVYGPIHRPANEREFVVTGLPDGRAIDFQIAAVSTDDLRAYSNQPRAVTKSPAFVGQVAQ